MVDPVYELDRYFPPRYLALAIPAVIGIIFVCGAATLIGVIMIVAAKEAMQREIPQIDENSEEDNVMSLTKY